LLLMAVGSTVMAVPMARPALQRWSDHLGGPRDRGGGV
jgi:hypothetical protein